MTAASSTPADLTDLSGLRPWQVKAVQGMRDWELGTFLIAAAPGAGKTRPALHFAREELASGRVKRVVVVCPTAPLTRQWAAAAAEQGLQLLPDSPNLEPPSGFHGVSVTYARAAASAKRWRNICRPDTLIIADEAHHLGEDLAWGDGFNHAFGFARRWMLLSGTPFRSDRTPIPGAEYDNDGFVVPDISYNYGEAIKDRVCRPVRFIPFDGTLQWVSGDKVVEGSFADPLTGGESARRYRTAISTDLADGLPRILGQAAARLRTLRETSHPEAGGLVVAADSEHARRIARILREDHGEDPLTVLHTDVNAHKKLAAFNLEDRAWIVAVNMVSEGVDIPRLRVGVYAAAAKTPLIFRQVVGRFVRVIKDRPPTDRSWMYIPADSRLRQHMTDVEGDIRHVLLPKEDEQPGEFDEEERERSEPGEKAEFKPVMADVRPQMDLFAGLGGGEDDPEDTHAGFIGAESAAAEAEGESGDEELQVDALDPWALDDDDDDEESAPARSWQRAKPKKVAAPIPVAERPAWEHQEQLRKRRHSLVSELARSRKATQAQVNAEINQAIGVGKVDQASNEQLEASISLLLDRLSKGR